ncbi:MAG: YvcK family protein [Patescibacteria group bacterium]|nr:YvcK family protein [Patescibacteria group bacterium]
MKKIVAIGGGTGLSNLLRGLKEYPLKITAIVAMTDDGASTGRLRRETGMLPPGDIRKCIAALAKNESDILDLFNFRFKKGFGISGHSMGNLFLSALTEQTGSFERAVEKASEILNIMGKVIPATLEDIHLGAEFVDGIRIMGQVKISQYGYKMRIKELFLSKDATANPRALDAIKKADIILVGPGSLFSSIFPSFLLRDFKKEFQESKAKKIYIANVSTERGETDDFKLSDHLNEVERYIGEVDLALANNKMFPQGVGDRYVKPVEVDVVDGRIKLFNLADVKNPLFHDSKNLAEKIAKIIL